MAKREKDNDRGSAFIYLFIFWYFLKLQVLEHRVGGSDFEGIIIIINDQILIFFWVQILQGKENFKYNIFVAQVREGDQTVPVWDLCI